MSKIKTAFFCQHCGYESPKWLGKCPSCEQWNGFVEELITKGGSEQKEKENWSVYTDDQAKRSKTIS
ncbi:MAG TPA: DNA repair protein RadA, partial [Chitinophagaceae bacterium]|nr:DNA repair protein RadA [Chitinophagaceae bacterium]